MYFEINLRFIKKKPTTKNRVYFHNAPSGKYHPERSLICCDNVKWVILNLTCLSIKFVFHKLLRIASYLYNIVWLLIKTFLKYTLHFKLI